MNRSFKESSHRRDFVGLLSAGVFFILVGAVFVLTPGLFDKIVAFFKDFTIVSVPNSNIQLPAPEFPGRHSTVYTAVWQFSVAWGLFQVVALGLRVINPSPLAKKAEAVSDLVFWLGASFLVQRFLLARTMWFVFWTTILILIGVSLVIRGIILAAR